MNIFSSILNKMSEILSFVIKFTEIFLVNFLGSNSEPDCNVPKKEETEESFEMV